jgi:hypothetical protein
MNMYSVKVLFLENTGMLIIKIKIPETIPVFDNETLMPDINSRRAAPEIHFLKDSCSSDRPYTAIGMKEAK